MSISEISFVAVLTAVNLVLGLGLAIPVARLLRKADDPSRRLLPYVVAAAGVYFLECVAFAAGMATQVFSLALALVWGLVAGLWLPVQTPYRSAAKIAFSAGAYTTLPTASFCTLVPLAFYLGQRSVLSVEDGLRFGLPRFLPWPLNTVLGFCSILAVSTLLAKIIIIAAGSSLLLLFRRTTPASKTQRAIPTS